MSKILISTTVNGEPHEFACDPGASLLDALRDELNLTGSKEGCGSGDCGACTVTLDGVMVCSCLVLAPEVQGRRIGTIEGLAEGGTLHPLQQKFLEHAALRIVGDGINRIMRKPDKAVLLITHYQRLLDYVKPDFVHVLDGGRITRTGGAELALELERDGYKELAA